jgi:hypothetical protein
MVQASAAACAASGCRDTSLLKCSGSLGTGPLASIAPVSTRLRIIGSGRL